MHVQWFSNEQDELIGPRTAAIEKGIIDRTREPFGIRFKTFWYLEDTEKILTGKFAQELIHEPDGVIFQPMRDVSVNLITLLQLPCVYVIQRQLQLLEI